VQSSDKGILPEDVAAKYQIADGKMAKFYCAQFGLVDLTKISLERAAQLADAGYLVKKEAIE